MDAMDAVRQRITDDRSEAEAFLREHPWIAEGDRREHHQGDRINPVDPGEEDLPLVHKSMTPGQREMACRVEKLLERMLPLHRQLLKEYYWERLTQKEMAERWGLSQQNMSKRLAVARGQFQVLLAEHGLDLDVLTVSEEDR